MHTPMFEVTIDGSSVVGPVTVDQIRQWLAADRLSKSAWVRPYGTQQWHPVGHLFGQPTPLAQNGQPDARLAQTYEELQAAEARLSAVRRELESVEEAIEIQSFGFYRPKYGFHSSDQYAARLTLHKEFAACRVNMVNARKEYFRVSLDQIRAAVEKHHGLVTFVITPEAEQWRKTRALLEAESQVSEGDVLEVT